MNKDGFSLAEVLISMMLLCLLMMATLPVFTMKNKLSGIEPSASRCVNIDLAADMSLDLTQSACGTSGTACCNTVQSLQYGIGKAFATVKYFAEKGNATQQNAARKLFKEACDRGGAASCQYLVNSCIGNSTLCNITSGVANDFDMHFYLNLPSNDNTLGRIEIKNLACSLYKGLVSNITNIVNSTCPSNSSITACAVRTDTVCGGSPFASPAQLAIQACNNATGVDANCTAAYNNNWNRSCSQIKTNWSDATDAAYSLTYDNSGNSYKAYCDMESDGGWTLVMKANSTSSTLQYDSGYWTNQTALNATSADLSKTEHKNASFWNAVFSQIKLIFNTPASNTTNRSVIISKSGSSLYNLFLGSNNQNFDSAVGAANWKNLIGSSSSLHTIWQSEGINKVIQVNSTKVRLGIITDDVDGSYPDGLIGIGSAYIYGSKRFGAGNYCSYSCDNGNVTSPDSFAYLYVK